jgi:hypothetical protein
MPLQAVHPCSRTDASLALTVSSCAAADTEKNIEIGNPLRRVFLREFLFWACFFLNLKPFGVDKI